MEIVHWSTNRFNFRAHLSVICCLVVVFGKIGLIYCIIHLLAKKYVLGTQHLLHLHQQPVMTQEGGGGCVPPAHLKTRY